MANNIIKRTWVQDKLTDVEDLRGMAFQLESGGHVFEISGSDGAGNPISFSGSSTMTFVRPDGAEIRIVNPASAGKISITLTRECYAIAGRFFLTIYSSSGGTVTAVYAAVGTIALSSGTSVGGSIPPLVTDSIQTGTIETTGNVTVGGILDVVTTRATAAIASPGWYRIVTYTAANAQIAQGRYTLLLDIIVGDIINDAHKITLALANSTLSFLDETGKATGGALFDKVRYTYNGSMAYVDVHFVGTTSRTVWAFIDAKTNPDYRSRIASQGFVAVADAPTGETILGTYTFIGTTQPVDISSAFEINTTDITVLSSTVNALFDPKARKVSIDFSLRASAAFAISTPFMTCTNALYRVGAQTDFPAMIYNTSTSTWDAYYVRAYTNGQFQQRLSANTTKVFGHIEYYV